MSRKLCFSIILLATAGLFGCDSSGPAGGTCNAGSNGRTSCAFGTMECSAGQYCQSDAFCDPGCTSDANCLAGDRCERAAGQAVGTCTPCTPVAPVADAGPMTSGSVTRCQAAMQRAFDCGHIDNAELAAGREGCVSVLQESERVVFADCVDAAAACPAVQNCLPDDGSCSDDSECVQTPGIMHEICSGGACIGGCRMDTDCGNDYVCDTFINLCMPDF